MIYCYASATIIIMARGAPRAIWMYIQAKGLGSEMKKKSIREIFLYGFFGLITTLVNLVTFIFLQDHQHWPYMAANATAMILSLAVAFVTNKYFVFQSRSFCFPVLCREFRDFMGARLLSVFLDMGAMYLLVSCLGVGKNTAKIGVSIVVVILNYLLSKLWVFRKNRA